MTFDKKFSLLPFLEHQTEAVVVRPCRSEAAASVAFVASVAA